MIAQSEKQRRIVAIDMARGLALVAMAIYHLTWDLTFFGYLDQSVATTGPMRWFARAIASSFLFLVGVSLVLAHSKSIRWPSFWRRLLLVTACASIISVATWFADRETFVYFGILHHIALASLLGLAFVTLRWPLLIVLACLLFLADFFFSSPIFDSAWLLWTGLNTVVRPSNDYVPIVPWFGCVLLGMAFAKSPLFLKSTRPGQTAASQPLQSLLIWMGRRSLLVYMVHQPILIALVYLATLVVPPQSADEFPLPPDPFLDACESTCLQTSGADFCISYCACVDVRLQQQGLKADLLAGRLSVNTPAIVETTRQCTADIAEAIQEFGDDQR
ncbi:MAG: heparan-alpha-glucosaminide N-acetyltransferase [Pseudomonadota bacterium]